MASTKLWIEIQEIDPAHYNSNLTGLGGKSLRKSRVRHTLSAHENHEFLGLRSPSDHSNFS